MLKRVRRGFLVLFSALFIFSSCSKEETLELAGKTVAVEIATSSVEAAKTIQDDVKEIQEFSSLDGAVSAVESGEVDFVVMDEFSSASYIEGKRKIKEVKILPYTTEYCAYFNKSSELVNEFNRVILELTEEGIIEEIRSSYKTGETYYPKLTKLTGDVPILTIAIPITGYPFSDLKKDGTVIGIDVDIATLIANRLGYNIELVIVSADEAFNLLGTCEVDFIISGFTYDSERAEYFNCSVTYFTENYVLLSKK